MFGLRERRHGKIPRRSIYVGAAVSCLAPTDSCLLSPIISMNFSVFLLALFSAVLAQQQQQQPAEYYEEQEPTPQQYMVDIYQDTETGLYYEFDQESQEFEQVNPAELDFYPADEEAAANFQAAIDQEEQQAYEAAYNEAYETAYNQAYEESYQTAFDQSFEDATEQVEEGDFDEEVAEFEEEQEEDQE